MTRLAEEVARTRNWPRDWLNDGVRTYLSPQVDGLQEHHILFRTYPIGLRTPEEVVDFAADFYPEARISGRLRLGIHALWRVKDNPTQEGRHAAPDYLGRGGSSP